MHPSTSKQFLSFLLLCTLAATTGRALADDNTLQPFPDKTRWDLVGDSITQQGMYGLYTEVFYHTRFPKNSALIFNCGIAGETAEQGLKRYSWDMAANNPTVASIMFGMNDINRWLYRPENQVPQYDNDRANSIFKWEKDTRALIDQFKKDNVQVILIAPSIFDETSTMSAENAPGINSGLGKMADLCVQIASDEKIGLVDFYHPMLDLNTKVQAATPAATIIGPDRIHPGNAGQLFMAYLFLTAQHVPTEIAHMTLDGMSSQLTDSGNCTVTDVKNDATGLSFTYLANALPFPIDPDAADAVKWAPQINDLNREMLTVSNLASGTYQLTVDGQKIRTYTADELKAGVNLALETSMPEYQQALKVLQACKGGWGSGYVLRTIAIAEAWAPDLTHPVTLAQMEPILQAKLVQDPGQADNIAKYREDKPLEEKTIGDVTWSDQQATLAAQPTTHSFTLAPVAP